jgi:hypothetical protein
MRMRLVADRGLQWVVVAVLLVLLSVVGFRTWGQTVSPWDRAEVELYLDQNPGLAVRHLEAVLTVEQRTELWNRMFPAPTAADLERGYARVKLELRRMQLDGGDAVVVEVDQRLGALKGVVK